MPDAGVGQGLGVHSLGQEKCVSQKPASGVIRGVKQGRVSKCQHPAQEHGSRAYVPRTSCWGEWGGSIRIFPKARVHGVCVCNLLRNFKVDYLVSTRPQVEAEASGRPRLHAGTEGNHKCGVPVRQACECMHLSARQQHQAGQAWKLEACTAGARDWNPGRGMAWTGHASHPQMCTYLSGEGMGAFTSEQQPLPAGE